MSWIIWAIGGGVFVIVMAITLNSEIRKSKKYGGASDNKKKSAIKGKDKPLQDFLPIVGVEATGELELVGGHFRRLIRVGNINPYSLSESEIRSVRNHFQSMFSMLHNPIQFIVRGRRMDLTDYRQDFERTYTKTAEKWGSDRILEYGRHLEAHLVEQGNKQRTVRENLFITEMDAGMLGTKEPEDLMRLLNQETETVLNGLSRCRVNPQAMNVNETIEALQFFWNRDRVHARARDAVTYGGLKEYLTGDDEGVSLDAFFATQKTTQSSTANRSN